MGWQVFPVDHEHLPFRRDRLGVAACSDRKRLTILDVGCGGGRTIQKLAALATEGMVYGVDYAKGSVAASRGKNAQLIETGRVEIKQASVSQLPFPENKFDLVTAVETQYYWPDLVKDMQEILRVLKPGGTLIVIAESYKKGARDWLQGPVMKLMSSANLGVDEHRELFSTAGYTDVQIFEERSKGWICGIGRKAPSSLPDRSALRKGNLLSEKQPHSALGLTPDGSRCRKLTHYPGFRAPSAGVLKYQVTDGGDTVSTEAVAARRHAGRHLPAIGWNSITANQPLALAA